MRFQNLISAIETQFHNRAETSFLYKNLQANLITFLLNKFSAGPLLLDILIQRFSLKHKGEILLKPEKK